MEAGGGAGSGTRVSEGAIAYTLGREPHTGTGIAWTSSESDASLAVRACFYGPLLTTFLMSAHRTV